jgi:hypothetical protein
MTIPSGGGLGGGVSSSSSSSSIQSVPIVEKMKNAATNDRSILFLVGKIGEVAPKEWCQTLTHSLSIDRRLQ